MDQSSSDRPSVPQISITFTDQDTPPRVSQPSSTYLRPRRGSLDNTIANYHARLSGTSQVIHGTSVSFDAAVPPEDFRRATEAQSQLQLTREATRSLHELGAPIALGDMGADGTYIHRVGTASSEVSRTWYSHIWHRYIRITVPEWACRDMFALERTLLGYLRTSQSMAMLGVTIAQFMRLTNDGYDKNTSTAESRFGFFKMAVPLASTCYIIALIILMTGTVRYYQWQVTMAYGNGMSSGPGFLLVAFLTFAVLVTIFVLNVTITAERPE